jgi:hypothetical protein
MWDPWDTPSLAAGATAQGRRLGAAAATAARRRTPLLAYTPLGSGPPLFSDGGTERARAESNCHLANDTVELHQVRLADRDLTPQIGQRGMCGIIGIEPGDGEALKSSGTNRGSRDEPRDRILRWRL